MKKTTVSNTVNRKTTVVKKTDMLEQVMAMNFHTKLVKVIFSFAICVFSVKTLVLAKENTLIQQLENIKQQAGVSAVTYALVESNRIIATGGIGQYSFDNKREVTEDSLFRVGSITKTFTSLAVMKLVEQNKLQLNQAIKKLVPDLPLQNPWPQTPVTLAMLLEHTAGLQDLTQEEFNYPLPLSLKESFTIKPETKKLHWPPGYHFSYSNVGAGYVGRVIEIVTQENYDDWFEREVLAAMGMSDSQLRWTKNLQQNLITGYDADLKKEIPYWHTLFRPFGGLNTTARDMAKFLLLFTDQSAEAKKIISTASIRRMETAETSFAAKAGLGVTYGLGIRGRYIDGRKIYGHGGDADGYLAEFAYSRESQRGYFVMINAFRHDLLESFTERLDNWLIEDLANNENISLQPVVKSLSQKDIKTLVGDYHEVTRRFPSNNNKLSEKLHIKNIDNDMFRCFTSTDNNKDSCTKIVPVTESLFRTENQSHASMAFIYATDKNIYLQTGFGNYKKE